MMPRSSEQHQVIWYPIMSDSPYAVLAERIDRHVELLISKGLDLAKAFEQTATYLPQLDDLWLTASEQQLAALFKQYPHFRIFCDHLRKCSVEQASKQPSEQRDEALLSVEQRSYVARIMSTGAELEQHVMQVSSEGFGVSSVMLTGYYEGLEAWRSAAQRIVARLKREKLHEYGLQTVETAFQQVGARIESQLGALSIGG